MKVEMKHFSPFVGLPPEDVKNVEEDVLAVLVPDAFALGRSAHQPDADHPEVQLDHEEPGLERVGDVAALYEAIQVTAVHAEGEQRRRGHAEAGRVILEIWGGEEGETLPRRREVSTFVLHSSWL